MARKKITDANGARADLGPRKTKPDWREGRHTLPFHELGDDEFEVFCFLLLVKEHPGDHIYYYGKTADGGRDIVHKKDGRIRLIQCKRYTDAVGISAVRGELAKLCVNVFEKRIPEAPQEVHFYAVPRLSNPAADQLKDQAHWRIEAPGALKAHLKKEASPELLKFAHDWWPDFDVSADLSLTDRALKFPALQEEFFGVKKVIDGSIADMRRLLQEFLPTLNDTLAPKPCLPPTTAPPSVAIDAFGVAFAFKVASTVLLSWPTTVGNDRWLNREELTQLVAPIASEKSSTNLLLGTPGSGKSALLAKLGRRCEEDGHTVLAIKADTLGVGVDSEGKLSEDLHLPALVTACVRALAPSGKVVVLIDQLDALADLVDLRSERLNVLLSLIKRLSDQSNVHVVCSCRAFEYSHDVRLTSINADVVQLALPTWEQVAEVLNDRQIDASRWPAEFRELLRTPQHLKVFLQRLQGTAEDRVFTTYQQLLEDLWARCVTNADGLPGRSQLLMDIAELMAERETIWLPCVRFEDRQALVTDLEAKSILVRSENSLSLGFQHQTLFEHARARAFARGHGSLAAYVLERQDGLFVRPILWSSLHFLRGADPDAYHREMTTLWREPLRKHVRHLLIDFLGQVSYPLPFEAEQRWLICYLKKPEYRAKVLAAIRGNPEWFTILATVHFPPLMCASEAEAWPMVAVLGAAWRDRRSECLNLIRQHWWPNPSRDALTWRTMEQVTEWGQDVITVVECIIQRADFSSSAVMHLASQVGESVPDLAVHLVAVKLRKDLALAEAQADPEPPALPPDADESARVVQEMTFQPKERFESLLSGSQNWYDLPALAEAAPRAFVDEIWPWFVRVVGRLVRGRERMVYSYRADWSLVTRLRSEEEDERMNPVVGAIEVALHGFAQCDPTAFLALVEWDQAQDTLVVQRLFCRTLHDLAASHPTACLTFLIHDPRRLALGPYDDELADSRALIELLVPHLTEAQAKALEDAILGWKRYRGDLPKPPPEMRFQMNKWEREHRVRLLTAFPLARLSAATQLLVGKERVALPGYEESGIHRIRGGIIGSPMSAEQMAQARDDDIVRLFVVLEDTADHHPKDFMRGGSYQASQEFGRFAKAHPERAIAIIGRLKPCTQEHPAAYALDAIADDKQRRASVLALVLDLDARGFRGEEFRVHAARAIEKCVREGVGLPDAICAMLERWLAGPWTAREAEVQGGTRKEHAQNGGRLHSILWQRGGAVTLPFGAYHVLRALTFGYLLREPPDAGQWLRALEEHLERDDQTGTWSVLTLDLPNLRLCECSRVVAFLERLFEKYPGTRDTPFGAALLTHVWSFLPAPVMQQFLQGMRDGGWVDGPQANGELLAFRVLLYPEDQWAKKQVHRALKARKAPEKRSVVVRWGCALLSWLGVSRFSRAAVAAETQKLQGVRIGLAFAAAQLWHESHCREQATGLLVQLIPLADAQLSRAIMHVFLATNVLFADEPTRRLLRTLITHPEVLRATEDRLLVDRLEDILSAETELVCDFCREFIRILADERTAIRTAMDANTSHLTNIALTVQRLGGDYRRKGLDLFEMLLDLGVHDAQATLQELDKRPRYVAQPVPRRLRRRKN